MRERVPTSVAVGLALTIVLDTGVQVLWKSAVSAVPEAASPSSIISGTLSQPVFYVVVALFMAQFCTWMKVLSKADLSFAQPITALSFIPVGLFSTIYLHEQMGPLKVMGITLILLGTWFISQTKHNTLDERALVAPLGEPVKVLTSDEGFVNGGVE